MNDFWALLNNVVESSVICVQIKQHTPQLKEWFLMKFIIVFRLFGNCFYHISKLTYFIDGFQMFNFGTTNFWDSEVCTISRGMINEIWFVTFDLLHICAHLSSAMNKPTSILQMVVHATNSMKINVWKKVEYILFHVLTLNKFYIFKNQL